MDVPRNGTNSLVLGISAALGVAAVTGVIGWTFAHVVDMASSLAHLEESQRSQEAHDTQQDRWIDELNRKTETNQTETRTAISKVTDLLNDVRARTDGKSRSP